MKLHEEEVERFKALLDYKIMDTGSEDAFDELARLAAYICKTPIALISFVDENREWFKSIVGIETDVKEVPRDRSFGAYVINHSEDLLSVSDPHRDERTVRNPMLNSHSEINYIAGVPLVSRTGYKIGTICVLGYQAKELSSEQISFLQTVARSVILRLEKRLGSSLPEEPTMGIKVGDENPQSENGARKFTEWDQSEDFRNVDAAPDEGLVEDEGLIEDMDSGEDEESSAGVRSEIESWIDRLERQNKNLVKLCEMDELLQASRSEDEVHTIISSYSSNLFPENTGALYIFNDTLSILECVSVWGTNIQSEHEFLPDKCWALRLGRLHTANDSSTELYCQHLGTPSNFKYFCAPLLSRGRTLGLLFLQEGGSDKIENKVNGGQEDAYKQHVVSTMAKLSGLALANIKHHETLKNFAIYDSLTGLFNRRYMEETLRREISRVARSKEPLGLIMVDIDHFKQFNDTYGHTAGDTLLRSIGEFFKEKIRCEDIACRYGGEEFVLILPGSSLENTLRRAEQLHEEIKRVRVRHRGNSIGSVAVSMGVVVFSEHGHSAELLLESADKALYQAKSQGRNRIVVA